MVRNPTFTPIRKQFNQVYHSLLKCHVSRIFCRLHTSFYNGTNLIKRQLEGTFQHPTFDKLKL